MRIRFSPKTEADLSAMESMRGLSRAGIIHEAPSVYYWMLRERQQGSKLLVQRGLAVTEIRLPEPDTVAPEPAPAP